MKSILITGARGYVGSRLLRSLLAEDHDIDCLLPDVDVRDMADLRDYKDHSYDYIVHLAARTGVRESIEQPEEYWSANVDGFQNVLELCKATGSRLLYASSSNAYEWYLNPYATTKRINELQAKAYSDRVESIGMRLHTVYPGRPDMLFARMYKGQVDFINADCHRDYIHISDVCSAVACLIRNFNAVVRQNRCPVIDIGTGNSTSIKALAQDIFGFKGDYRSGQPAGERKTTKADPDALLELGWSPTRNVLDSASHGDI